MRGRESSCTAAVRHDATYHRRRTMMLDVRDLTKTYRKTVACDHVSFHLDPGSVTVLLGPNGAGKSTVIKSAIGFLRYTGSITVGCYPNKSVEARRILGYIPEIPSLYPNLTVSEHMEFIARAYKLTGYKPDIEALFDRFELSDKRRKYGDELSKGMQQKLNICLGLLPRPRVLLLDEPMIGLDPHAIKELKSLIVELREQGCTILVSTHMIDSVDMLWDRAIIMQSGTVRANLTKGGLDAQGETLEELFFGVTEGIAPDEAEPAADLDNGAAAECGAAKGASGSAEESGGTPGGNSGSSKDSSAGASNGEKDA